MLRLPEKPQRIYSVNEGNYMRWSEGQRRFVDHLKGVDGKNDKPFSARYIGSLVADFHRNLLKGGIYIYPATSKDPNGKLRLIYECNALAFLAEQAGGKATDGERRIMEIEPENRQTLR